MIQRNIIKNLFKKKKKFSINLYKQQLIMKKNKKKNIIYRFYKLHNNYKIVKMKMKI